MAHNVIKADDSSLRDFEKAFANAADQYTENLKKLDNLIQEITSGQYTGTTATKFKEDYDGQAPTFKKITQTLENVEVAIGQKRDKFDKLVNDLSR